jgi:DNA-directed RNA polymerase subunit RPC12/RpoP
MMHNEPLDLSKKMYYRCRCGYILSYLEVELCRFDFGCPRCKRSFEDLSLRDKVPDSEDENG